MMEKNGSTLRHGLGQAGSPRRRSVGVIIILACFLFNISTLVFAEHGAVVTFKTYLAKKKSANNSNEITNIERQYRPEGYIQGVLVLLQDIDEWKKSELDPNQIEITSVEDREDNVIIEYTLKDSPNSFGRASLIKENGIWKIKEYGLIEFIPSKSKEEFK